MEGAAEGKRMDYSRISREREPDNLVSVFMHQQNLNIEQ